MQKERLEKLDELGMATMRIQLLAPGDEVILCSLLFEIYYFSIVIHTLLYDKA